MNKYKCSQCNSEWFSIESLEQESTYHDHPILQVPPSEITEEDYVVMWESDLEDANRHSLTSLPNDILGVLCDYIEDKDVRRKIMKDLYDMGAGI